LLACTQFLRLIASESSKLLEKKLVQEGEVELADLHGTDLGIGKKTLRLSQCIPRGAAGALLVPF